MSVIGEARWKTFSGWQSDILSGNLIVSAWTTEDVITQAEEDGVEIARDQAREVLTRLDQNPDSETGINWSVISCVIAEVLQAN